jgi:predicted dehydrogenase
VGEPVSLVMVGIGGMGAAYLEALLARKDENLVRITGAVDPRPNRCKQYVEMRALGVPCFVSLQDFYRNRKAELAILSSPIQAHMPQTTLALSNGSHVLCEKPAAGTIQEVRAAVAAERDSGRWVAVGYQWSFSGAVQALKADIRAGLFGAPKAFKCLYLWPRDEGYYARNDWAGKKRDAEGNWILDSPVQNAMAHDLHNMFYVLGPETDASARPVEVEAELYKANAIENFDTAAVRARTAEGVELLRTGGRSSGTSSRRASSVATAGPRGCGPSFRTGRGRTTASRMPSPWPSSGGPSPARGRRTRGRSAGSRARPAKRCA